MTNNNIEWIYSFIQQAPVAVAMLDQELCFISASQRWLTDFSLTDKPLQGIKLPHLLLNLPSPCLKICLEGVQGKSIALPETRYEHSDGTVQWFRWQVRPWFNHDEQGGILVFSEDITCLKQEQDRFRVLVESSPNGMMLVDEHGLIQFINKRIEEYFGYRADELLGQSVEKLLPEHLRVVHGAFRTGLQHMPHPRPMGSNRDLYGLCKNGQLLPIEIGLTPIQSKKGWHVLASIIDITERKRAEAQILRLNAELDQRVRERTQQLEDTVQALSKALEDANHLRQELREQAIRDSLTGLYNRRYLEESLERELMRAKRAGSTLGIILFDVDNFKYLNDQFGHFAGDHALQMVAQMVQSNIRGEDIACRYGGDEFVVAMPSADLQQVLRRANDFRERLKQMWAAEVELPELRLSIGVAEFPAHGTTVKSLLLAADSALYRAKQAGRDRVMAAA